VQVSSGVADLVVYVWLTVRCQSVHDGHAARAECGHSDDEW